MKRLHVLAAFALLLLTGAGAPVSTARAADSPAADLEVVVEGPGNAVAGRNVFLAATVANHGPDTATGVRVTIRLSGSFDLVSINARGPGSSCAPPDRSGTIVCELAELAVGGLLGIAQIVVNPTAEGEIAIAASVSANETDPVPGNDTAGASVAVTQAPTGPVDLYTEIDAPEQAFVDGLPTVLVRTRNNGPDAANAARLRVTVTGAYRDLRGATFKGRPCTPDGDAALVCELGHLDLAEFGFRSTVIWFVPTAPGVIRIDVEVTADQLDLDPSNNVASALLPVGVRKYADLSLALTATPNPAHVGRALTYELTAANHGPDAASDVVLDFGSGDVRLISAETSHGTCDLAFPPAVQLVSSVGCALGRLEAGESASIRVQALPTENGTFTASARVGNMRFGEVDGEPGNDAAVVTTEVTGPNRAATFGAGSIFPVALAIFVPCAGDLVVLEGSFHASFRLTIDASGTAHLQAHSNAQRVVGFALGSGTGYRSTGVWNAHETFSPPLARTLTFVTSQRFVGQGAAADLTVHARLRVTVAADGEMRTVVDDFRVECG